MCDHLQFSFTHWKRKREDEKPVWENSSSQLPKWTFHCLFVMRWTWNNRTTKLFHNRTVWCHTVKEKVSLLLIIKNIMYLESYFMAYAIWKNSVTICQGRTKSIQYCPVLYQKFWNLNLQLQSKKMLLGVNCERLQYLKILWTFPQRNMITSFPLTILTVISHYL